MSIMKLLLALILLSLSGPLCLGQVQHIVIVIQENRTPDNLFGSAPPPGADITPRGPAIPLGVKVDPLHTHAAYLKDAVSWSKQLMAYVQQSDVQPYFDLAQQYGFANQMFQTNQGPSGPAHQFLFSGTSAESDSSDLFESENISGGCLNRHQLAEFIDQWGNENHWGSPCLNPTTLSDLLDRAGITWKYYAPSASTTSLWNAPSAIQHICFPRGLIGVNCSGQDWENVILNPPQVLTDIARGNLAQVSWVVPAAPYSDHPSYGTGGPAWVSSIVNAIGQSSYWQNTVVLVTWDDWGGWYDHVPPPQNNTGWCLSYCYGFRVPLLMISAATPPNCIDNNVYDFGSILAYVEDTFALGRMGHADSYATSLGISNCLPAGAPVPLRPFKRIKSRPLTRKELSSKADPDDY
jgi:phospholipase C